MPRRETGQQKVFLPEVRNTQEEKDRVNGCKVFEKDIPGCHGQQQA